MKKTDFLKAVADKAGSSVKDATKFFDAYVDVISSALKGGDSVAITGFGTYELKQKPAREGINPLTKEKIKIKASKAPAFKFSKAYKDTFN